MGLEGEAPLVRGVDGASSRKKLPFAAQSVGGEGVSGGSVGGGGGEGGGKATTPVLGQKTLQSALVGF